MIHFSGTFTTKVEKSKPSLEEDKSKSVLHSKQKGVKRVTKEKSAKINVLTLITLLDDLTIWHINVSLRLHFDWVY